MSRIYGHGTQYGFVPKECRGLRLTQTTGAKNTEIAIIGAIALEEFAMNATTQKLQAMISEGKAPLSIEVKGARIGDC